MFCHVLSPLFFVLFCLGVFLRRRRVAPREEEPEPELKAQLVLCNCETWRCFFSSGHGEEEVWLQRLPIAFEVKFDDVCGSLAPAASICLEYVGNLLGAGLDSWLPD